MRSISHLTACLIGLLLFASGSVAQVIRIEAESGQLNGFSTLLGGTFIDAEVPNPTATYTFPGADGTYAVVARYCDEDDGTSSYELRGSAAGVFATWDGDQPTGSTLCQPEARLVRSVATSVGIHSGDTITFSCQRDAGEPCRVDYFEFTYVGPLPPSNDLRIEAESGQLNGFSTLLGGTFVEADVTNPTATYTFTGTDGTYAIIVRYCDEDDGTSSYELSGSVSGQLATWDGDLPTGSTLCSPEARLVRSIATSVRLRNGETITFECQRDSPEPCRVDYFDFIHVGGRAFPGAAGFGSRASGARDLAAAVCVVTNLDDSGPGSFRACAEQVAPAYITFAVSGYIDLLSGEVDIAANKTIECATAPGDGVVFRRSRLHVSGDHTILRGCRAWPGGDPGGQPFHLRDAVVVGDTPETTVRDVMVANSSMMFGTDEVAGTWNPVERVTFQHNIIAWGLRWTDEEGGTHNSFGTLFGAGADRVSMLGNFTAFSDFRNPRVSTVVEPLEIVNNLMYCHYHDAVDVAEGTSKTHVIGNRFKGRLEADMDGCDNSDPRYISVTDGSTAYEEDNTLQDGTPATLYADGTSQFAAEPLFVSNVPIAPSQDVEEHVFAKAGPAQLISFEMDAFDHYVNGTGAIIDSVDDLGGWPTLQGGVNPADTDGDGMPDWWETAHCGGPCAPSGDHDGDGFENIEEWFHSFYTEL